MQGAQEGALSTTTGQPDLTVTTGEFGTTVIVPTLPPADVVAVRMPFAPQIDADPAEWTFPAQAASDVVVAQEVSMSFQPSAVWAIGWDDQALYVFADVFDPEILQPWVNQPDQLWQGDSVSFEFGQDPSGLDTSAGLRPDDVHVVFGPSPEPGRLWEAIAAVNRVRDGAISPGHDEPDIEAVSVTTTTPGYWIEASIPWHVLGVSNPAIGAVFGVNFNVSDGDGAFRIMVSSNPDRNQPRPETWDTLVLGP